ncbi:hypothetical protein AGMMS49579_17990 [Spirochaetia bacterium]|nr:hypothetical protein AGMMS49579_17990 [Spirochaetia bacterium]
MSTNWLPGTRVGQLALARQWKAVLTASASGWSIPAADVTAFTGLITTAAAALEKVQDKATRTHVDAVACDAAFKELAAKMRYLKNNYFNSPPRTASELASLELSPRNPPTDVPPPRNQVTAKHRPLGDHLIELVIEIVGDVVTDNKASDYGFSVYWGIMPAGGASVEAATGRKRELLQAPVGGEDLPFSRFTRKKKEVFDFDSADRGKTVYFCLRLENAKGQVGPWGPILDTVIP